VTPRHPDRSRPRGRPAHATLPRRQYQRARRGANRASLAVAHSLLTAVWHMLQTGQTYLDPGGDYYTRREPARTTRRFVAQLERLGHTVTPHRRGRWLINGIFHFRDAEQQPRLTETHCQSGLGLGGDVRPLLLVLGLAAG
jgi:hypothetical protein